MILLAIVGAAVGAGVAASKDNGHRSSAAPSTARSTTGSMPQVPAAVTVRMREAPATSCTLQYNLPLHCVVQPAAGLWGLLPALMCCCIALF